LFSDLISPLETDFGMGREADFELHLKQVCQGLSWVTANPGVFQGTYTHAWIPFLEVTGRGSRRGKVKEERRKEMPHVWT
jgi:hypothetical protein